jgi:hypothetical protein
MNTIETDAAGVNSNQITPAEKFIPNIQKLSAALRKAKNHKQSYWRQAQDKQMTILVHLYEHEKLSMVKLRSMMNYDKLRSYRHTAVLKHLGLIDWKGSHKNGAYVITEAGREFVERNG